MIRPIFKHSFRDLHVPYLTCHFILTLIISNIRPKSWYVWLCIVCIFVFQGEAPNCDPYSNLYHNIGSLLGGVFLLIRYPDLLTCNYPTTKLISHHYPILLIQYNLKCPQLLFHPYKQNSSTTLVGCIFVTI